MFFLFREMLVAREVRVPLAKMAPVVWLVLLESLDPKVLRVRRWVQLQLKLFSTNICLSRIGLRLFCRVPVFSVVIQMTFCSSLWWISGWAWPRWSFWTPWSSWFPCKFFTWPDKSLENKQCLCYFLDLYFSIFSTRFYIQCIISFSLP